MTRLAATVADQLALALANLQLQASLRNQSIRDPLTNLSNRRYLEASLPRELLRTERRAGGLSLLMLDLDRFKHFNDSQGHDAGDALLGASAPCSRNRAAARTSRAATAARNSRWS